MKNRQTVSADQVTCLVDGKPSQMRNLAPGLVFVGMEAEPNRPPRYGKLFHPWFNKPCYETRKAVVA